MTEWQPPSELPDLRRAGIIALDLETKDDGLAAKRGSSWPWGAGHICGVSAAWKENGNTCSLYVPICHPDSENFDCAQVYGWLKDLVASDVKFVTQNGLYDFGWLRTEASIAMPPAERLEEIGALATMIDENRLSYSLDALCAWRGIAGKDESLLKEAAAALGAPKKVKPQSLIWQMPAHVVGPYAEQDAASTLALFESLDPLIDRENLRPAYRLEVDLLPMVLEMRRRGIRIDQDAAERARNQILERRDAALTELSTKLGAHTGMTEIRSPKWLECTFAAQEITVPKQTPTGKPSFTAGNTGWLTRHPHWLPALIVRAKKYHHAGAEFLQGVIDHMVNGRVHAEIHPHRSDDGGTRTTRFSYSHPALQQTPKHDAELGPLIRGVFLPDDGEVWAAPDLSQQEFRILVHFAVLHNLPRAQEVVERYVADPATDAHNLVAEMTGLARQSAKNTNYAKSYGAGVRKFAEMIDKPVSEARTIMEQYDRELPFVSALARLCERTAKRQGYIELLDGARRHFGFEVGGVPWGKRTGPCDREEAERRLADPEHPWHGLRHKMFRAETHKALNSLIQGSAARLTKLWMRDCWREGIVPLLQMHDSLDCSVSSPEQAELVAQLGRDAVKLAVPMKVDLKFGRSWGDAVHTWEELDVAPAPVAPPKPPREAEPDNIPLWQDACLRRHEAPVPDESERPPWEPESADSPTAAALEQRLAALAPLTSGRNDALFAAGAAIGEYFIRPGYLDRAAVEACFDVFLRETWKLDPDNDKAWGTLARGLDKGSGRKGDGPIRTTAEINDEQQRTLAFTLRLWERSKPITSTLAAGYLSGREIDLTALPANIGETLRFHPRCPFGRGVQHPCLVALFLLA